MSEIPKNLEIEYQTNRKGDTILEQAKFEWSVDPETILVPVVPKKKIQRVFFWMLAMRMDAIGRNWLILANGQKLVD